MAKRHSDALAISDGTCNPSGIALSIAGACREVHDEHGTPSADAAVRLMVYQLADVCHTAALDDLDVYNQLMGVCQWNSTHLATGAVHRILHPERPCGRRL